MRKFVTLAVLAGAALGVSACGQKAEQAPVAEPTAEEMMAPAETPAADATDEAAMAAEGQDGTANPIGPGKGVPAAPSE